MASFTCSSGLNCYKTYLYLKKIWFTIEYFPFSSVLQGKFIRINFDVTGYIVGANIETCILILWVFLARRPL